MHFLGAIAIVVLQEILRKNPGDFVPDDLDDFFDL